MKEISNKTIENNTRIVVKGQSLHIPWMLVDIPIRVLQKQCLVVFLRPHGTISRHTRLFQHGWDDVGRQFGLVGAGHGYGRSHRG